MPIIGYILGSLFIGLCLYGFGWVVYKICKALNKQVFPRLKIHLQEMKGGHYMVVLKEGKAEKMFSPTYTSKAQALELIELLSAGSEWEVIQ